MENKPDLRQYAPATQRNREPILAVLRQVMPSAGTILEIASGSGEHGVFFAQHLSPRQWLPSDPNPDARASIAAWRENSSVENLLAPILIDACQPNWPIDASNNITAVVNVNMIHISPWAACIGLMAGVSRILPTNGILYLYGPFKVEGKHTAPSNQTFDQSLRSRNPEWGVRDLEAVVAAAKDHDMTLIETIPMPANNLSVVFKPQ